MRIVRGRVSKTNLPDYADEARTRKLKEKENMLSAIVYRRIIGYPNDEYETKLRKNIQKYYEREINVDQAERSAVQNALRDLSPVPEYEPRYMHQNGKRVLVNPLPFDKTKNITKLHYITKNGKRFRIQ